MYRSCIEFTRVCKEKQHLISWRASFGVLLHEVVTGERPHMRIVPQIPRCARLWMET